MNTTQIAAAIRTDLRAAKIKGTRVYVTHRTMIDVRCSVADEGAAREIAARYRTAATRSPGRYIYVNNGAVAAAA